MALVGTLALIGFMLFYVSLFMALVGTLALIGFIIRFIGLKRDFLIHSVKTAFRQAFLFAFFIIAGLFMLAHNLFSWFNLIILIIALSLLEFFLLSYKKSINQMDESNITLPAMESEKKEQ